MWGFFRGILFAESWADSWKCLGGFWFQANKKRLKKVSGIKWSEEEGSDDKLTNDQAYTCLITSGETKVTPQPTFLGISWLTTKEWNSTYKHSTDEKGNRPVMVTASLHK